MKSEKGRGKRILRRDRERKKKKIGKENGGVDGVDRTGSLL